MDEETTELAWGVELWDQADYLLNFTQEQNAVSQNYLLLFSELQKMHHDIAKRYKKTFCTFMSKKKNEIDLSYRSTFLSLARSFYDMSAYHEDLAKSLDDQILNSFKQLTDSQKQFVNSHSKKRNDFVCGMEDKKKQLEKSWSNYLKSHKDKNIARDQSARAQKDEFLPRVEQRKYEDIFNVKKSECNHASMKYANDLTNFNQYCSKFYTLKNMEFITEIEELDVSRTYKTRELIEKASDLQINSMRSLLEEMEAKKSLAGLLDDRKDRVYVLNKLRTEFYHPPEAQFLDLDVCPTHLLEGPVSKLCYWLLGEPSKPSSDSGKAKSSFSIFGRSKKEKEDMVNLSTPFFGGLGVKQVKLEDLTIKQIDKRILAINTRFEHLSKELEASTTMENIYSTNARFGDADSVEKRVATYTRQLRSLEHLRDIFEELNFYDRNFIFRQKRYQELGGDQAKIDCIKRIDQYSNSNNIVDSVDNPYIDSASNDYDKEFDASDEEAESVSNPASGYVGKAIAIYDYDGNGNDYLPATQGQSFEVVAFDNESTGWTEVVDPLNGKSGFVPTDFVKITKY